MIVLIGLLACGIVASVVFLSLLRGQSVFVSQSSELALFERQSGQRLPREARVIASGDLGGGGQLTPGYYYWVLFCSSDPNLPFKYPDRPPHYVNLPASTVAEIISGFAGSRVRLDSPQEGYSTEWTNAMWLFSAKALRDRSGYYFVVEKKPMNQKY